jgi:hypothetical protein
VGLPALPDEHKPTIGLDCDPMLQPTVGLPIWQRADFRPLGD